MNYDKHPKPIYGHLVRVPVFDTIRERSAEMTVKEARQLAKRYRKAARRIEKAIS